MTSLLLLAISSGHPEDEAISRAKRLVGIFDVKGPLRLASFSHSPNPRDRVAWFIGIQGKEIGYEVALRADGRALYVEQKNAGGSIQNPPDPSTQKRVTGWLRRLGPAMPICPDSSWRSSPVESSSFFFQGLLRGYPVVYPRTRYGYQFLLNNGHFYSFSANEEAPQTGSTSPTISETQALAAVDRIFKLENPTRDGWTFSYQLYDPRELGWAVPDGGGPARLAWRVPFMFQRSGKFGAQGGSSGMLIDAATGEKIKTPTVP